MGKSTGKPDNGNLDIEIMRSYSSGGPMRTIQRFVSYPALCLWTDDVGSGGVLPAPTSSDRELFRLAVCYITGVVHTDGNVQNADASSMSMSWPIDGDVYIPLSTASWAASSSGSIGSISTFFNDGGTAINTANWQILGG